ncbi:MAG: amidohydrolase family protein [Planctomycetes bacterium]|nr:amidohydrolase family protein [Planctomycetota bacterium]
MSDTLITGARVVTPKGVMAADVAIRNGKIVLGPKAVAGVAGVAGTEGAGGSRQTIDAGGKVLLPGFVDIHTHGYEGFDFTLGLYDAATDSFDGSPERSLEALGRYVTRMAELGVTTTYLATMAAETETLRRRLSLLETFLKSPPAGTRVLGAFLEGTFVNDKMVGAMNPDLVHRPDGALFDHINETGQVKLCLVTPEFDQAALTLVRHLGRRGVVCGAGHTQATAEQIVAARRAGLRYMVHFLNGPTGTSFKPFHGGGAVEGALADEKLYCELIADGYHVNPRYARDLIARKGFERIIAVSDAMFAAGARGLRTFQVNGVYGVVGPGGKYLQVAHSPQTLFGSCLNMPTAFGNLVSWLTAGGPGVWVMHHPGVGVDEALTAAALMTSGNPCRMMGLDKRLGIGSIATGRRADLVLADLKGKPGDFRLEVHRTWIDGREVYAK